MNINSCLKFRFNILFVQNEQVNLLLIGYFAVRISLVMQHLQMIIYIFAKIGGNTHTRRPGRHLSLLYTSVKIDVITTENKLVLSENIFCVYLCRLVWYGRKIFVGVFFHSAQYNAWYIQLRKIYGYLRWIENLNRSNLMKQERSK